MAKKNSGKEGKSPEPMRFEEHMARLEEIVSQLESDDLALEESLALFEEGVTLSKTLDARLSAAEMKVEQLLSSDDGDERVVPLVLEDDEDAP